MSSYEDDRQREGAEERDQDQQRKDVLDQDEKMKDVFETAPIATDAADASPLDASAAANGNGNSDHVSNRGYSRDRDVRDDRDDRERHQSRDRDYGRRDDRERDREGREGGAGREEYGARREVDRVPPNRPATAPAHVEPNAVLGAFQLSIRTRERDLEEVFGRYGKVEKVAIVYDQRTDRSRGFAFVTMSSIEEAAECIDKLNGLDLNGRRMRVDYSTTRKAHDPTPGAYMGERRPTDRFERAPPPRMGGGGGHYGGSSGGYDRYDRGPSRYDDRRGGAAGYDDRRGGASGRYEDHDRRDRYRDDYRRGASPPRRSYRDDYPSRSRYSASPSRGDERDPRASSTRAYDDVAPAAGDARY